MTYVGDVEQLEELTGLLTTIDSPGVFACGFEDTQAVHPGLAVEGVGIIALPLQPEQAKILQSCCQAAPFGRGEQTLWDPTVRRTWQLAPSRVGFNNPGWQAYVDNVTSRVTAELGVDSNTVVNAQLYKLLLYQEGDHFVPHRDTEKTDGMFATMTILLPSQHMGGQLVVHHANQSKEFDFGAANGCSVCCAAFYADCKHELKPVQTGFRLALVYNLVHVSGGPMPVLKDCSGVLAKIKGLIQAWGVEAPGQNRAIWMLEHKYSEAGLQGLSSLKNKDRAVAAVLQHLAGSGCLDVHIVFIVKHEMGRAEGYESEWSMDEVCDTHYQAKGWVKLDGSSPAFKHAVTVEAGEILQGEDFFGDVADEEECEEATGNEGATMNRFYHRAALMIWPKAQRWRHMCCSQNLTTCMSALEKYAKAMHANQQLIPMVTASKTRANSVQAPGSDTAAATSSAITGNEPVKDAEEACQLAEAMWSQFGSWQLITNASKLPTARFSQLVSQLGMHALLTKLAHKMQNMALTREHVPDIIDCAAVLGWEKMSHTVVSMSKALVHLRPTPEALASGFLAVAVLQDTWKSDTPAPPAILANMCKTMADQVMSSAQQGCLAQDTSPKGLSINTQLVIQAAKTMTAFQSATAPDSTMPETDMEQTLDQLVNTLLGTPRAFPPVEVLASACFLLSEQGFDLSESKPMLRLMLASEQQLELATRPQKPKDWVINVQVTCQCSDCCKLQAFLLHPSKRVQQFNGANKKRAHVQQQIKSVTEDVGFHGGTPQTLVCTKNRNSYNQKVADCKQVTAVLKKIKRLIAQVMAEVPAELGNFLLPTQQPQETQELADAQKPTEQILAGQSEDSKGAAGQQNVAPRAKRRRA